MLEKSLDFAPIQIKINEPEPRQDFPDFDGLMCTKCFFRNKSTLQFSEIPVFPTQSTWKPPKGHPNLEVFLSQLENEIFKLPFENLRHRDASKEEWETIRASADDHIIVIEKADKGLSAIAQDRPDYLLGAKKQLNDTSTYKSFDFKEILFTDLIESSNKMFLGLKARGLISQKELYFTDEFKKSTIPKRLSVVTGKLVTFNYVIPPEEASVAPKRPAISN